MPGLSFVLMPVLLQNGVFYGSLLVVAELIGVDHVVKGQLANVVQIVGRHVQADGTIQEHAPKLEERVEGQCGHVRLGPAVAALLNVLLEFDPPER